MKLGLFSYSYHLAFGTHDVFQPADRMTLFQFIDRASTLGLDGIQIDPMHYASLDDDYLAQVKTRIEQAGFFVEHGAWGVEEATLRKALDTARKLGAPLFRTALGFTRHDNGVNVAQRIRDAIAALNQVKHQAEEYGVTIAIENHCDATTDELINIMRAVNSPNVGVCVDPGNFMSYFENPATSIVRLAPYIVTTHLKDYAVSMENYGFKYYGVPLGEGVINLPLIVDILKNEVGLDYIVLEVPVEKEVDELATLRKEDEYVRRSVRYAREILDLE